ncbi:MAG TPA: M14 family zinc carboxypeptidase [Gemmatimonadaceae bacterium]|nr:M14 family zinc carboxypeptidase [Gemmatimonadaceae bacterium]
MTPTVAPRLFVALVLSCAMASPAAPQYAPRDSLLDSRTFSFYDRGPYRAGVPRPETTLGYDIGSMNTQFAAQERTLLAIADAAKDRVRVEDIGTTYERRTMRIFIVSAPENIQRLDAIRTDLARLADPRTVPQSELDALIARTPAVVWLNHSVHGNESSGFETAMQTLYQLAASEEPATLEALRNVIVIINPSSNPDGHERFAVWYNSINVANPDPGAYEHDEPWSVQGRFNHYRFDMNRDVMATSQREVQAIVRAMLRWPPMVAADLHGHTEQFFFPPVAKAVNEHLAGQLDKWLEIYGRSNAAAFDRYGWLYYSRDIFDFYAVFYWDTWPSLTGGIGMTFETDGGGWKGLLWERQDGSLLSFRDGIAKHYVASLATVEATARHRAERLGDFVRYRQDAIADGQRETMRRIVLVPGADPGRAAELVSTLLRSGIEVRRASGGFSSSRAHAYGDGAVSARRFEPGAYVVDLAQPHGRMARAFLEPTPSLDTTFARVQIEKFRRNLRRASEGEGEGEGYEFYDLTAWSLPVAFGVDAYWTEDVGAIEGDLLSLPAEEPALPQAREQPRRIGGELLAVPIASGIVGGTRATSAYVFGPERNGSARLAYHLLAEGYRVAVASQPIEAAGRRWARGTYVVRVTRNDSTVHDRIDALSRESGVEVMPVNTAYTDSAQYGIGSEPTVGLQEPDIAIVSDEGISQTGYGAIWWAFERRYGIRFTPVSLSYITDGDIAKFNVIILPPASPGALGERLGKEGADRLREWARAGGTLITMAGSSAWAASESANLTSARRVGSDAARDTTPGAPRPGADSVTAARRQRERASERQADDLLAVTSPSASDASPAPLPGSHFDAVLDRTHWLTHGFERPRITVMVSGSTFFTLSKEGTNVGVFAASGPLHRAGFIWPDNTERLLRGTAFLIHEPVGDGHIVLFANEPMFRGWWRALDRLVLNAILLGPTF